MVFCVGTSNAGKSLLCLKLATRDESLDPRFTQTQPTVGVNHFKVDVSLVNAENQKREPREVILKELGGQLSQNWLAYVGSARQLIYLIDISNPAATAEVGIHLVGCLDHLAKLKESTRVLIVYAKIDLVGNRVDALIRRIRNVLRLTYLLAWYQTIEFQEVKYSACENEGLPYIRHWLRLCDPR